MSSTPSPLNASVSSSSALTRGGGASLPSSPSSNTPSEKSRRYDRQLRLWGDHGQRALERAHVCLLGGANATGCEMLKSLVLPGLGAFTIVDPKIVTKEDVGNNFFLDLEHVGQARGSITTSLLLEMNNEVRGHFVEDTPEKILNDRPDFLKSFALVIATEISEKALKKVSQILWEENIPLMAIRSYGLVGCIRQQIKEHPVIESHPDNKLDDFRLDVPFPGLVELMDSMDLDSMTNQEHSHTPYLVVLYKFLQKWKEQHGGNMPKTYQEKRAFKEFILEGKRKNSDGVPEDEENFDEAAAAVNFALAPTKIPDEVKAIMDDPRCTNLDQNSADFWHIMRGIKEFVNEEGLGHLPCSGSIPDMFSDSERYVLLQNVYRAKAAEDAETVLRHVQNHLEEVGRPAESISDSMVKLVCKEAYSVRLVGGCESICEEYEGKSPHIQEMIQHFEREPESPAIYYFILRGVDRFFTEYNALPGVLDVEADIGKLKTCVAKVTSEYQLNSFPGKDDFIHEVCRYGGCELHAMASIIGGCAAHEAIKLITGQYIPVDNLFIYNTNTSETMTLKV